jgi:hypothetical protein
MADTATHGIDGRRTGGPPGEASAEAEECAIRDHRRLALTPVPVGRNHARFLAAGAPTAQPTSTPTPLATLTGKKPPIPMRHRAALSAAVFLFASLASAEPAAPDPAKIQAASEAFDEGSKAFKARDYDAAALAFEAADRAAPSPAALANAIRARKLGKQLARAATLAAAALVRYPSEKEIQDISEGLIQSADKQLHRVTVSCKPECSLLIDGKVATGEPVSVFVAYVDPGTHSFVAGWSGDRKKTAPVAATAGGIESLDLVAPELPKVAPPASAAGDKGAPPPAASADAPPAKLAPGPATSAGGDGQVRPPEVSKGGLPPWVVFLGGGATVILGGVATWSGLDTQQNPGPDAVRAACAGQPSDCSLYRKGLDKERRTNILFGATAGAAVVTGVVAIFFTDWSGGKSKDAARLTPTSPGPRRAFTPTFGASPSGFVGGSGRPDVSIGMEGVF